MNLLEKIEYWPLDKLQPFDRNPKKHPAAQIEKIVNSINQFGFNNPILVAHKFGIVAGHGRYLAAKKLKLKKVPVIVLNHLTPIQAQAYLIADNRIGEDAPWDEDLLKNILWELETGFKDLTITGFDMPEIDRLMASLQAGGPADNGTAGASLPGQAAQGDPPGGQATPREPAPAICSPGETWALGDHRLYCGDATRLKNKKFFQGNKIDLFLSDPPYNVAYDEKIKVYNELLTGDRLETGIENDKMADPKPFFKALINSAPLAVPNSIYIFMSFAAMDELKAAGAQAGLTFSQWLIWNKNLHSLTRTDYKYKHDFIYYGWKHRHKFYGEFATTVLDFPRVMDCTISPTMKPVPLLEYLIKNSSKRGGSVYDPCGGSGSTLIAAENTARRCFMIELKNYYCNEIIKRWQDQTGRQAVKI